MAILYFIKRQVKLPIKREKMFETIIKVKGRIKVSTGKGKKHFRERGKNPVNITTEPEKKYYLYRLFC
jgi:hypothetical protein